MLFSSLLVLGSYLLLERRSKSNCFLHLFRGEGRKLHFLEGNKTHSQEKKTVSYRDACVSLPYIFNLLWCRITC